MRQAQHVPGFGQRADLVDLDQDGVAHAPGNAALEQAGVRAEHIVAHQLAASAQAPAQGLPALDIVLGHAVLDGDDGVVLHQLRQVVHLLLAAAHQALARVAVAVLAMEFTGRRVQGQGDVPAGAQAGALDGGHQVVQRLGRAAQGGRKAALVAHVDAVACGLEGMAQRVEDLGAHAQRLTEAVRPHRQQHELLEVQRIVGMGATVDDIDHGHGQHARLGTAHVPPQRHALAGRRRAGHGQRHAQQRVGAQPAFAGRAVQRHHGRVDAALGVGLHAAQQIAQLGVDGLHRPQHALAQVARGIAVAPLQRLMPPRGGARGHQGQAACAVLQLDLDLHGGMAPAVQRLMGRDIGDLHGNSFSSRN